jgi:maltooligosyltrehalose trehalohydrolase
MGEEFAAAAPFHYFVSHTEQSLIDAVRAGRHAEHEAFGAELDWADPQDERTFEQCKLDWSCVERAPHAQMLAFYRDLYALRRRSPALSGCHKELVRVIANESESWLALERGDASGDTAVCVFNFDGGPRRLALALTPGRYELALASWDERYGGEPGSVQPRAVLTAGEHEPAVVQVAPLGAAIYLKTRA